jgi:hypothetical protein
MVNYQLGKVYKLECNVTGLVYIGSTCEPILARRLAGHVGDYKRYLNGKGYYHVTSFKIIENGNYDIVLLEKYPCDIKDELLSRERYWTQQIECVNKNKAGIYNELGQQEYYKQYRDDNKETLNEKNKQHYENNKAKIQEYKNKKYICICDGCYTKANTARHERSNKHQEYLQVQKFVIISEGIRIIHALDNHFKIIR